MGAGLSSNKRARIEQSWAQARVQTQLVPNLSTRTLENPSSDLQNAAVGGLRGDSFRGRLPVVPPSNASQTRLQDVPAHSQEPIPSLVGSKQHGARQDSIGSSSSGPSIGTLDALYPVEADQIIRWGPSDAAVAPRAQYTASKPTSESTRNVPRPNGGQKT